MKTKLAGILFLLVFVSSFASAACVAHWSMNNTGGLTDACSATYTLTNHSADDGQACVFDECYNFVAASSHYMDDSDLDLASDFTICAWYKPATTGAVQGIVSKYSGVDLATNYVITLAANKSARLFVADAGTLYFIYANQTMDAGKWYLLCAWFDDTASQIGFWLNGSRAGTDTGPGTISTSAASIQIGRISAAAASYANGLIDDVWIFNHVLNSTEVNNLMTFGAPTAPVPPVGCTVSHVSPANATFNTTSQTMLCGQATCYQSMNYNCSTYVNGSFFGWNTSAIANATTFCINTNTSNGVGLWDVNCSNSTFFNSTGSNWTIYTGAACAGSSAFDYDLMSKFVWNNTDGRNLTYYNQTGVVACSNTTNAAEIWGYNGGRNLTYIDWNTFANWTTLQGYVWNATVRTLTAFGTLVADIEAAIWGSGSRTLTNYNNTGVIACSNMTSAADVWTYTSRIVTNSGPIPTDVWAMTPRTLTEFNSSWVNCTGGANATYNVTANCSVNVDGCTRPIVLKTGDCS